MKNSAYTKTYEKLAYNLYRLGFPMMHDGLNTSKLNIETLIVQILTKMPNPRFILGIPVIMHKNKVNTNRLYRLTKQYDAVNPVGWILEEFYNSYNRCAKIKRKDIKDLINRLKPLKKEEEQIISIEKYESFVPYARERQTSPAKKWHILSGFTEESFDYEFKRRCLTSLQKVLEELIKKN